MVSNENQITPFGFWLRQYCRDSREGLVISNLDYVITDYKIKKIMLLEEKAYGKQLYGPGGQSRLFKLLDEMMPAAAEKCGYDYWGFFLLVFPPKAEMPGPGMKLNGSIVTNEQLQAHLNFDKKFCNSYFSNSESELPF